MGYSAEEDADDEAGVALKGKPHPKANNVSIYEPMSVWILMLLAAVALKVVTADTAVIPAGMALYQIAQAYSNFILQFPGTVILPLLIGAIIGAEVGARSSSMKKAARSGLLNGVYAAVIYVVVVIVIFLVIGYFTPSLAPISNILLQNIVLPVVVFLITLEAFTTLSYSRRVDS